MAGVTATISMLEFRADWVSHMPISSLCQRYTISKDQVIRLRDYWQLPLRNDRRLRFKPARCEMVDPTPEEIVERCKAIQAGWDDATREARSVVKRQDFAVQRIRIANIEQPGADDDLAGDE